MRRDRLGRRRTADQGRGLRPLHPALPHDWASRAIRVAMSRDDWDRFEAIVRDLAAQSPELAASLARAHGEAIARLLDASAREGHGPGPLDWMDWERQKALRLLRVRTAV